MYWYNAVINLSLHTDWSSCHVLDPINYWKIKLQRHHQHHHQKMTLLVTLTDGMHITLNIANRLYLYEISQFSIQLRVSISYWVASYSYVSIYVCICTHACVYIYSCVYAYMHMYLHAYMWIYKHVHTRDATVVVTHNSMIWYDIECFMSRHTKLLIMHTITCNKWLGNRRIVNNCQWYCC